MKIVLNIIWFILFGLAFSAVHFVLAGVFCLSIIGFPVGKAFFEVARLIAFPFGKTTELYSGEPSVPNIIWGAFVGAWVAIVFLLISLVLYVTIILIPFANQCVKIAKFAYCPFGSDVYHTDMLRQSNHSPI